MKPRADVLLSVPTRGQIGWATVTKLEQIQRMWNVTTPILYQPGNMSVAQTRNYIVKHFLEKGDWAYLVMVDDDIVPPSGVLNLCGSVGKSNAGEDELPYGMLCIPHVLPTPDKTQLAFGVFNKNPKWGFDVISPEDGLHECDGVATGCVVIPREVFADDVLGKAPFKVHDDPEAELGTDDFVFCLDLKEAGYRVGYWWDGHYCDHHRVISLGLLMHRSVRTPANGD